MTLLPARPQQLRLTDPASFEAFYRRHAQAVLVFFARRTLDPDAALDLTAETFAIALAQRKQFRGASDAEAAAWLLRIADRQFLRYHRARGIRQRAVARLGVTVPSLTDADAQRLDDLAGLSELRSAVRARLSELPCATRDAVLLRVVHELEYPEVARRLGVTEQAARARVSRGLRTLRAALATSYQERTA
jgi:RNA polymerase sigma-70 factor (ECF subfamily)